MAGRTVYFSKYMHIHGCQKFGTFIYQNQKIGPFTFFFFKKNGYIIYLTALKKGAIRHAHPYYVIYRELSPSPEILMDEALLSISSAGRGQLEKIMYKDRIYIEIYKY